MAITEECHPHCGIRSNAEGTVIREGHCGCPETGPCPQAGQHADLGGPVFAPHPPMCERWYERAGSTRPWIRVLSDVTLIGTVDIRPDAVPYGQTPQAGHRGWEPDWR